MDDSNTPFPCRDCGKPYPRTAEYFNRDKSKPDGLRYYCKSCHVAKSGKWKKENWDRVNAGRREYRKVSNPVYAAKEQAYRSANRERISARAKQYRADNYEAVIGRERSYYAANRLKRIASSKFYAKQNRARIKAQRAKHYQENRSAIYPITRAYALANPSRRRGYRRIWRQQNKHKVQAISARRRALVKDAVGSYTGEDVLRQFASQKGRCWWCGKKVGRYHVDHVMPLAKGGSNGPENIVIACSTCNCKKGAKLPLEFAGRLF